MIASKRNPNSRGGGDAYEFVHLVYEIFVHVPYSWPPYVRKRLAKVFHYGGCHSRAGTSAVDWINDRRTDRLIDMVTSWVVVSMFPIIPTADRPDLRRKFHDQSEAFHRFAGWTAFVSFWTHNIRRRSIGHVLLVRSHNSWFIGSVSTSPQRPPADLTECHAFATIPADDVDPASGNDVRGFSSVVVSRTGDWTARQIRQGGGGMGAGHEERRLWVRDAPLHGLLYTSKLSGASGPCLSLLFADETPRRGLRSTRDPRPTYPEMVCETWRLVRESGVEAVFAISNPEVTEKVVFGMQTRGIPAYGAILDS
ncbi:hypothetical protein GGR56DRAFT_665164 [Xylariaceae sp. FL0804]|nr:hypothetical protein GGR56DRAFT_665164 [Xylariaceae sp. FL0804]